MPGPVLSLRIPPRRCHHAHFTGGETEPPEVELTVAAAKQSWGSPAHPPATPIPGWFFGFLFFFCPSQGGGLSPAGTPGHTLTGWIVILSQTVTQRLGHRAFREEGRGRADCPSSWDSGHGTDWLGVGGVARCPFGPPFNFHCLASGLALRAPQILAESINGPIGVAKG